MASPTTPTHAAAAAQPVDIPYLLAVSQALDDTRVEVDRVDRRYWNRVLASAPPRPAPLDAAPLNAARKPPRWRVAAALAMNPLLKATRALVTLVKFAVFFPLFVVQAAKLAAIVRSKSHGSLILAMASNRLCPSDGSQGVRAYLASVAKTLGNCANDEIADKIMAAESILLFDSLPLSRFWRFRASSWNDNVIIIDGMFLLASWLIALACAFPREFMALLRSMRASYASLVSQRALTPRLLIKRVSHLLIANACAQVLRGVRRADAVVLTCNCSLTELLRAYLIQYPGCRRVFEIMHGIGTVYIERYFATMLAAGRQYGASDKHLFIPQIPRMPLYGVFQAQLAFDRDVAINAYLNQYLQRHLPSVSNSDGFLRSECGAICSGYVDTPNPVVLTIFGNALDAHYLESNSFQVECLIISLVAEFRKLMGTECLVIYAPHPAVAAEAFEQPVFKENRVKVYRGSVFCWLISDLCIALESSTMFEATHFGVRAFTPLLASDGIYTQGYLNLVKHPRSESFEDFVGALREFVVGYERPAGTDLLSRARGRLEKMLGTGPHGEATSARPKEADGLHWQGKLAAVP